MGGIGSRKKLPSWERRNVPRVLGLARSARWREDKLKRRDAEFGKGRRS